MIEGVACHAVDEVHAVGSWHNALIIAWRAAPTRAVVSGLRVAAERLLDRFRHGIGVVCVTTAELPLHGAADCQQASRLLGDDARRLRGVATVIEGSSFAAGASLSVMTAIGTIAQQRVPLRVFGTVDEAAGWLAPLLGGTVGPAPSSRQLGRAVEGVRRQLRG